MKRLHGLVLKVNEGERILLNVDGIDCWVGVSMAHQGAARLVVQAPRNVIVVREKLIKELERCKQL